jgi:ATP-dependent helicase/nuclease subunit A
MKSYLDMVLPAVLSGCPWFRYEFVAKEELLDGAVSDIVEERVETEALYNFDTSIRYDEQVYELLERMDTAGYEEALPIPVKVSVSDLKVKSMEEADMENFTILTHEETEDEMPVPAFLKEKKSDDAHQGAAYGTIWHQVLASIDFSKTDTENAIADAVEQLVQTGRLRREETAVLNYKKIFRFFESNLGKEMKKADACGKLHREQPFVFSRPVCDIFPERKEKEPVLIQGIIDAYYETASGIVLMDYKTDSLRAGEEEKLVERYATQMALYKEALETMMGMPVKTCILYSFSLGREVVLPEM